MFIAGGKKRSDQHAAVWVPDNEANVCMCCKKTQFTLIIRRHHCRNCGAVVCGPCSPKKFLLPSGSKPQRVCLDCYDLLSSMNNQQVMMWKFSATVMNDSCLFCIFRTKRTQTHRNRKPPILPEVNHRTRTTDKTPTKHTKRWVEKAAVTSGFASNELTAGLRVQHCSFFNLSLILLLILMTQSQNWKNIKIILLIFFFLFAFSSNKISWIKNFIKNKQKNHSNSGLSKSLQSDCVCMINVTINVMQVLLRMVSK